MRNKYFLTFFLIIVLTLSASARDFTPQGDINMRDIYDIINGANVTATNFSGKFYGDGSELTGINGSGTITGSGTVNNIVKFTASTVITDSNIFDDGTTVTVQSFFDLNKTGNVDLVFKDADATDNDDSVTLRTACTDTGSGTEDCDLYIFQQIAGTSTARILLDADGLLQFLAGSMATANTFQLGSIVTGSASCIDIDTDRPYADKNCDGSKGAGEEYLDQAAAAGSNTDTNVTAIAFTGTSTKTLNLSQDGEGDLTAQFTDINTFNDTQQMRDAVNASITYQFTSALATALAANGANCGAGEYPLGVDASAAVESCTDATTEIDSAILTHKNIATAHHTATVNTDSNTTAIAFTGTTTKTLNLSQDGVADITAQFTDIDTDTNESTRFDTLVGTNCAGSFPNQIGVNTTGGVECRVDTDTTYSAGNGISLSTTTFSVAGNTALTQDADGLSVTADAIGDTQLAFDTGQILTTTGTPTFATVDTGQGANELYDMDQNVLTSSNVVFVNVTSIECITFDSGGKICSGS